jgi:hypothetical protein
MPSYKVKIADSNNKLLVVDINLPTLTMSRNASNPDSNWTTETSGLIAPEMGRCDEPLTSSSTSATGTSDGSTGSSDGSSDGSSAPSDDSTSPISGDAAIAASPSSFGPFGSADLRLCTPTAPYTYGVVLTLFDGVIASNGSGSGQLLTGFTVSGGLAAGAITWVQV